MVCAQQINYEHLPVSVSDDPEPRYKQWNMLTLCDHAMNGKDFATVLSVRPCSRFDIGRLIRKGRSVSIFPSLQRIAGYVRLKHMSMRIDRKMPNVAGMNTKMQFRQPEDRLSC
jgi:hypothetical protein